MVDLIENLSERAEREARLRAEEAETILKGVREQVKECACDGVDFWHTCSGCYETEDGHDVGSYPSSKSFGCKLGGGCSECGGIGAIWDTTDYAGIAAALSNTPAPASGTGTRVEGLEEAARWHDREYAECLKFAREAVTGSFKEHWTAQATVHRRAACVLRALASREPRREEAHDA